MLATDASSTVVLQYFTLLADVISSIAWPVMIAMMVIYFSSEVRHLLLRLKKAGSGGVEFQGASQNTGTASDPATDLTDDTAFDTLNDPLMQEFEENNKINYRKLEPAGRDIKLIRALTVEQTNRYFALAYSNIYGSQIEALRILNSRNISRSEAEHKFRILQNENPFFAGANLEQYLHYLFTWRLIEEHQGNYRLTSTGHNFLNFLTSFRLSEERPN